MSLEDKLMNSNYNGPLQGSLLGNNLSSYNFKQKKFVENNSKNTNDKYENYITPRYEIANESRSFLNKKD